MGWNLFKTLGGAIGAVGGGLIGGPVGSWLGSSAGKAVIGGAQSVLGSMGSDYDQAKQNQFNREERIAAQEYNTREREESQRYQTNVMREMNSFNSQQRISQNQWSEDMYNRYESPEAKVQQYDAAGLNPRMAASGQFGQVQSSSSPQASSLSGPSGTHVNPPYQDITSGSQGFVNMANALKAIADAKKSGVETSRMEKFLDEEFKGLQLTNLNKELTLRVNDKYLDKQAEASLKYILSQTEVNNENIGKIRAEIYKLKKEGVLLDKDALWYENKIVSELGEQFARTKESESRADLNASLKGLTDAQTVTEQGKPALQQAEIYNLYAQGNYAKSAKEYNEKLTLAQHYDNEIIRLTHYTPENGDRSYIGVAAIAQQRSAALEAALKEAEANAKEAKERGDHAAFTYWSDRASAIIGTIVGGIFGFGAGAKGVQTVKAMKSSPPRVGFR